MTSCVAEVIDVKREPWILSPSHFPQRFLMPAAQAAELRNLGVYDEREIILGEGPLLPGDTIRFLASDSVLRRATIPDVFSNLREVAR